MQHITLSTAYLGPVEYYAQFMRNDSVFIEQYEHYQKQSYRNRCNVLSANGVIPLSIPVVSSNAMNIKDVCIADHGNWRHIHWNALLSAYNSTPFFEFYRDYFESFYQNKIKYLFDFNEELRLLIFDLIGIESEVFFTDTYKVDLGEKDFRNTIHPKKESVSGFTPTSYYQVFQTKFGFIPNLSIVDLLFNMGNESLIILKESYTG